eukprot:5642367-Pleurochrysis_carterae.AAC.3
MQLGDNQNIYVRCRSQCIARLHIPTLRCRQRTGAGGAQRRRSSAQARRRVGTHTYSSSASCALRTRCRPALRKAASPKLFCTRAHLSSIRNWRKPQPASSSHLFAILHT